ncbi:T9SS type A sorting domain-containing protein [Parabacteroides distasonis]
MNGVPVLTKDLNGDNRLDVSSLSDGVYILMIKKEKEILYHKIIKVSK